MTRSTIVAVNYHDSSTDPWPRILQPLAIVALLYGGAFMVSIVNTVRLLWPFQGVPAITASPAQYWLWAIDSAVYLVIDGFFIWGAVRLLRDGSTRTIVHASWSMILAWGLVLGSSMFVRTASLSFIQVLIFSLAYGAETYLFPLLIIALMRLRR